jgi:hypothetical protein
LKKLLARKPFEKRLERKSLLNLKHHDGVITSLLKKLLARKPFEKRLERKSLLNLKHHDGVINRRNGCYTRI